ncbi:MAG: ParB N-terminal domain-containing protein [Rhodospirillales bacterium]|jgi:sulfiredoxin|nr:ParB N-terminal domain-containing protein [Rhodospirillales bacterium]
MKTIDIAIEEIYVPVKSKKNADDARVEAAAEGYIETGKIIPVRVRHDGKRYVLVNGVNRLAALKALGEETITAFLVRAVQH